MKMFSRMVSVLKGNKVSPLRTINGKNVIFIHINKTGGTSVCNALGLKKSHMTAKEIIDVIGEKKFKSSYKIAAVRNPWDKVLSHYKYRLKTNQTDLGEKTIPFSDWVKKTYGENKDPFYYDKPKMFQPQVDWLKDYEQKIDINEIMKFEDLNNEFEKVSSYLDLNKSLPHLNATQKANYKEFYDDETKSIIEQWFAEDLDMFKYEY
ncbi:MAG: sulfotransferase family 2 domain-containing protein [Pseudomonadota bacterium]|nr:sulfotransferase family 2 domain-containing protein [Pseudomonadota bacterium]